MEILGCTLLITSFVILDECTHVIGGDLFSEADIPRFDPKRGNILIIVKLHKTLNQYLIVEIVTCADSQHLLGSRKVYAALFSVPTTLKRKRTSQSKNSKRDLPPSIIKASRSHCCAKLQCSAP